MNYPSQRNQIGYIDPSSWDATARNLGLLLSPLLLLCSVLGCNKSVTSSSSSSSSPTTAAHSEVFCKQFTPSMMLGETTERLRAGPYLQQSKSQSLYRLKYQHRYNDCTSKNSEFQYNFLRLNFFLQLWQGIGHSVGEKLHDYTQVCIIPASQR